MTNAKIITRDGKLTFYIPAQGSTRFNLQNGIEDEIKTLVSMLNDVKTSG